jgi:hypothetical protein
MYLSSDACVRLLRRTKTPLISEEDEKGREVTVSGAPKARVVTKHMTVRKIKNGQPEK